MNIGLLDKKLPEMYPLPFYRIEKIATVADDIRFMFNFDDVLCS